MKKVLVLVALATLVSTSAFALTTIVGSKHDLSAANSSAGGTNTEICVYCHTPHAASTAVALAPLWNRNDNTNATAGNVYSSSTFDYAPVLTQINATDAPLCLACHDGSVASTGLVNVPNGNGSFAGTITLAGNKNLFDGANALKNDHPIGMDIPAAATPDAGIRTSATILSAGYLGAGSLYGATNAMWCSSCHDVHDNTYVPFLRKDNAASNLCLACHNK